MALEVRGVATLVRRRLSRRGFEPAGVQQEAFADVGVPLQMDAVRPRGFVEMA